VNKLIPLCAAIAAVGVVGVVAVPASTAGSSSSVTISEKQWSISKPPALKHGVTYKIEVKNTGTIAHDLLIDGKGVSDRGIHNAHPIAPGEDESFTVKFPAAGTYRFYCAIKGHAAKGMQRNVKVS
jgi:uncharacterized cupredoxin-like copper-binding protein